MRTHLLHLAAAITALCQFCALSQAAAPACQGFFPPGGQRGTTVTVTAIGSEASWPPSVWCDRADLVVQPTADAGKLIVTIPAEAEPGRVWIRLYNAEGTAVARPFLIGKLPEIAEVEPNLQFTAPQRIENLPVVVNGDYAGGDVDIYAVSVKAGQTLVATLESNHQLGSPADPVLQILSVDGFVLAHNDDQHGFDPQLDFTAPADGVYLVRTFCFPAQPNSTIGFSGGAGFVYRLELSTGPTVDHLVPMAVGPTETPVKLFGWNLPDDQRAWTAPASSQTSLRRLLAPGAGSGVDVPVTPHPLLIEQEPNLTSAPQPITVPAVLTGHLDAAGDTDSYRFTAEAGSVWSLRVQGRTLGFPTDPVLVVTDALGMQLLRLDDVGVDREVIVDWTAPAAGEYQVTVLDLHGRGGWRFGYLLSITPPVTDYKLTVASDTFTVAAGATLEIPVTVERTRVAAEIEVSVTGLPAGVQCAAVRSAGEGETAKAVKLSLVAGTEPFAGPLQIRGVVADQPTLNHNACGPTAVTPATTEWLWLTVTPKTP